uniref:Endostatin domain-containing protein n=1 Tax=Macrostomum lignano TaxID=282301 RepID=A0A1I8HC85_9PLAT
EGAIVFTADEKELFLKIDHQLNEWISVASYILRLVALPYLLPGDLYYKSGSSILGGDYACQDAAQKVGMTRSYFKVFLNGMYSSLDTVVHRTQRTAVPVVNYYGQRLFNSFEEMLNNGNWNNRIAIQDFGGKDIAQWTENIGRKEILAWQGVRRSQRLSEPFTPDCEGFSNRDKLKTGRATNLLSGSLFQSREITCDSRLVVLCIEAFDENSDTLNPMDYPTAKLQKQPTATAFPHWSILQHIGNEINIHKSSFAAILYVLTGYK